MRNADDFPRFSSDEMASRHARTRTFMEEHEVEALLIFGSGRYSSEVYWLTDWPGSREAYVLFQQDRDPAVILQLYNHLPMARVLSVVKDVRWAGPDTGRTVSEFLVGRGLKGKRVGLVGSIPYRQYLRIAGALGDEGIVDLSRPFRMMRTVRSKEEIDRLQFASELTDRSIAAVADGLHEGMKECDIPALIEPVYLKAGGYAGIHFMTSMPMRTPHFPVPAQYQSRRRLAAGDCLITEISGAYWGYSGQIHRSFSIGEGPTPPWAEMHALAVEVFEVLAALIKDGTVTTEVEKAADLIHARGYNLYDDLLHGVSQYPPIIQSAKARRHVNKEVVFRENMVITIQPNIISMDEKMGLQFGETLLVGKNGCRPLNTYPRKWITCGA